MGNIRSRELGEIDFVFSGSVGPNSPSSLRGIFRDLAAWSKPENRQTLRYLENYCFFHKGGTEFFKALFPYGSSDFWYEGYTSSDSLYLGRLALKEEGAGKVRVFAIADALTQSVLGPLHRWVFK